MVKGAARCKRCGANLISDHGISKCPSCGWEKVSLDERHKFLEANAPEILKDAKLLGYKATLKKWGISSSTIHKLSKRLPELSGATAPPPASQGSKNHLPAFPEFSAQWEMPVQLKWLDCYRELSSKQ